MKKTHGLQGRPSNNRKGPARSKRVILMMPPALAEGLQEHADRLGVSRNQAGIDIIQAAIQND